MALIITIVSQMIFLTSLYIPVAPGPASTITPHASIEIPGTETLECTVSDPGNPPATFSWYYEETELKSNDPDGRLEVEFINLCQAGEYTCVPRNGTGDGEPGTTNVTLKSTTAASPDMVSDYTIVNTDDNMAVDCIFRADTYPVVWAEGPALDAGLLTTTPQPGYQDEGCFQVTSVRVTWNETDVIKRRDAGGKVTCYGENHDGTGRVSHDVMIDVQYAAETPNLGFSPADHHYAGDDVVMTCTVPRDGNPQVTSFAWFHDSSRDWNTTDTQTVTLDNVNQDGSYSCEAINIPHTGVKLGSGMSTGVTLDVRVSPMVTAPTSPTTHNFLHNGTDAGVSCTFSARPVLDNSIVTWYMYGHEVDTEQGPYTVGGEGATIDPARYGWSGGWTSMMGFNTPEVPFTCANVTWFDGDYACVVNDGQRSDTSQVISTKALHPAIWQYGSVTSVPSQEGNTSTLVCDVCMEPWGQFSWTLEGATVPENSTQQDNTLTIHSVGQADFGEYTCTAVNDILGEEYRAHFSIHLQLQGPPGGATDLTVEGSTSVSVTLGWTCDHNGGDPDMWFVLEQIQPGEDWSVIDNNIPANCVIGGRITPYYRVTGLNPQTEYHFRVRAGNKFDRDAAAGTPAEVSHVTTVPPNVTIAWLDLHETLVNLTWTLLTGKVTSLELRYNTYTENPSVSAREADDLDTWPSLANISAGETLVWVHHEFDLTLYHVFVLLPFEDDVTQRRGEFTGETEFPWAPVLIPPGLSSGAIVGIVISFLLLVVFVGAFVIYRSYNNSSEANSKPPEDLSNPSDALACISGGMIQSRDNQYASNQEYENISQHTSMNNLDKEDPGYKNVFKVNMNIEENSNIEENPIYEN